MIASPSGYQFIEEIGRGGMGAVFRARDLRLDRDVAIKVLLQKPTTNPEDSFRFFREEQITAQLQHPGIPPVHAIGTSEDGRPYLVMKLVQGRTLEDLCKLPGKINRWQLFDGICHTMAYAHTHGVIHRDLKPQNIMIGRFGEVQVMDWGIAKRVDGQVSHAEHPSTVDSERDVNTTWGTMVGTLAYMPPEQAECHHGEVGPWSDVFGLGGILLFMLTGRAPYVATTIPELRAKVKAADLQDAYNALIDHTTDPDLAILAMRCLSRSPSDRPQNASEVILELERLEFARESQLRDMELAKVATMTREVERHKHHRLLVRFSAILALVLIIGLILTTSLMVRARQAEGQAAAERDVAIQREQTEIASRHDASQKEQIATKTKEFLQSILRQTSAEGQACKKRVANPNLTLKEALDFAALELETRDLQSPLTEADLRTTIGIAYSQLKQHPQALKQLQKALELRQVHLGPTHSETADTVVHLCSLYWSMGRYADSEKYARDALGIQRTTWGDEHLKTLRTRLRLASALCGQGQYEAAESEYRDVLKLLVERHGETHADTLTAKSNLGLLYFNTKRYDLAEPLYASVIAGREDSLGQDHPYTLMALNNMAGLKQFLQKPKQAEALLRDVLARREKSLGQDHPDTITSVSNLGGLMMSLGQLAEAQVMHERVYEARLRVLGPDHPDTVLSINNLGGIAYETKDYKKALKLFTDSLICREKLMGAEHPETLASVKNVANSARKLGDWDQAEKLFRRIAEVVEKQGFKAPNAGPSMTNYAECLETRGKYQEAVGVRQKWLTELKSRPKTDPASLISELVNLGKDELKLRNSKRAIVQLKEAENLALSSKSPAWQLAEIRFKLGEACLQLGDVKEAGTLLVPNHQILIQHATKLPTRTQQDAKLVMIRYYETIQDRVTAQKLRASLPTELAPAPRPWVQ
ncbi:MAG: tetratricopeptide repeat protein [Fimbriiglobus sp.]